MIGWFVAGVIAIAAVGFSLWIKALHAKHLEENNRNHANRLIQVRDDAEKRVDRIERASSKQLERAHHGLLRDMLPAMDALDEAARHANDDGLALVSKKFDDALLAHGICRISPKANDAFDPKFHEAIEKSASKQVDCGNIVTAFRDGWMHDEDILRPAMVSVSCGADVDAEVCDAESGTEAVNGDE